MKVLPILLALFAIMLCDSSSAKQGGPGLATEIQRESSPPDRTGPLGGYAQVAERISHSVVSVFTSKKVEQRSLQSYPFFFEDPFFRHFFGDPNVPEQGVPRRREMPEQRSQGLGSGVILTSDGYIVTNNHVIDGADEIEVPLPGGRGTEKAKVIGRDPATDLALLKIDAKNLPAATIGDSSQLKPGDVVLAIGNPFGLEQTVTSGIVSAVGRKNLNIADYSNFIQTDASINPGNSGGALIDNKGRLIGINTAIFSRSGGNIGIGFAIPINMAVEVLDRLSVDGEVQRGHVGLILSDLTSDLAKGFGVEPKGALVNDVVDKSPAAKAGFQPGDVILRYQGQEISDMADLRLKVANTRPGTKAEFQIIRSGQPKTLTAEISQLPSDGTIASSGSWSRSESNEFLSGVRITDIDKETRDYYGIPNDVRGALVTRIEGDSEAARAGLSEGDVITAVGGHKVENVREALEARRHATGNVVVLRVVNPRGSRFVAVEVKNS